MTKARRALEREVMAESKREQAQKIVAGARAELGRELVDDSIVDLLADNTDWPLAECQELARWIRQTERRPLSCDAILVRPRLMEWDAYEDGEPRYQPPRPAFEGHTDEQLREWIQDEGMCDDELRLLDAVGDDNDDEVVREQLLELAWQTWDEGERWPLMNFAYSLPQLDGVAAAAKAQSAVMGLPLIVMVDTVNDSVMLALTGGGMDLSWDICRAYIACGYRPPLHFCDLPRMAGEDDLAVVDECQRSAEIAVTWARNTITNLMSLRNDLEAAKA